MIGTGVEREIETWKPVLAVLLDDDDDDDDLNEATLAASLHNAKSNLERKNLLMRRKIEFRTCYSENLCHIGAPLLKTAHPKIVAGVTQSFIVISEYPVQFGPVS